jgi:hypothetical protein
MLLQDSAESTPPMSEWAPEEIDAHIKYQKDLNAEAGYGFVRSFNHYRNPVRFSHH